MNENDRTEDIALSTAVAEPAQEPQTELAALAALLAAMQQDTARQCDYLKKQLRLTRLLTGACAAFLAVLVCVGVLFTPRISALLQSVDSVMVQAQSVAVNLESVSNQLAETDIAGMLQNVDQLVTQSQVGITQALGDVQDALVLIESFDIESLNASIQDLHSIISPLARLLGN